MQENSEHNTDSSDTTQQNEFASNAIAHEKPLLDETVSNDSLLDETVSNDPISGGVLPDSPISDETISYGPLPDNPNSTEAMQAIHFVAATLAPLFLHDPLLESRAVSELLETLESADPLELAATWPFVAETEALPYFERLTQIRGDRASLARDYRRLFVGPGPKEAPPWGSVYLDKDGVTFGASTLQLEDWLADQGISMSFGSSDEPEDSIGALLALLAWMAQERQDLVPELLEIHILTWSSHFFELMEQNSHHPFYQGLSGIARLSLEGMERTLGLNVPKPRFYR